MSNDGNDSSDGCEDASDDEDMNIYFDSDDSDFDSVGDEHKSDSDAFRADNDSTCFDSEDLIEIESFDSKVIFRGVH
jgi:hypothetical protein